MPRVAEQRGRTVSVWLPEPDAQLLRSQADHADRTMGAELRRALRPYIEELRAATGDRASTRGREELVATLNDETPLAGGVSSEDRPGRGDSDAA